MALTACFQLFSVHSWASTAELEMPVDAPARHAYTHTHIHIYTHRHIDTYTYKHINIYTYRHIHI